jgi:O-acetyl-ADP-ribose deacetylase (regulator of RNase III)
MHPHIKLLLGDITQQDVDAIVNAANNSLMGGGGVDGAIHRAGGPDILRQCRQIVSRQGSCPTGAAVITTGGNLKAKYVIHTVGPVWHGGARNEDQLLRDAYHNSLLLARQHALKTVAFPSISTGAYRFPIDRAARIALTTVNDFLTLDPFFDEVRFVLFSPGDLQRYQEAAQALPQI